MTMRALLITPTLPAATGNGLSMRAGMWLEALARRFDTDVTVAALFQSPSSAPAFTEGLASNVDMLWGTLPQRPGVPRLVPEPDDASRAIIRERIAGADVVVALRLYVAQLAGPAHDLGIPVVIDLDDLDWVREERLGDHAEAQAYRNHAARVLDHATVVTTASRQENGAGADVHSPAPWMHVPNGVREPELRPDDRPDVDLLFVSTLGYRPNADGAAWLVHEVLPRLPGVTAALIGAGATPEVQLLAGPGVTIAADVPEIHSWYRRARVCVVPIHAGSGTRTKLPEAWAHGKPIVTTTIGAEGIDVEGAALIADDAESFARACEQLLTDASLARQLTAAGTQRYREDHTLERAIECADAALHIALRTTGRSLPPLRVRM